MDLKEFITSGIIEVYCLGIATEEETALVVKFADEYPEVREEITAVNESLRRYAVSAGKHPSSSLKNNILRALENQDAGEFEISFPPRLSRSSTIEEWENYILQNKIPPPGEFETFFVFDLPRNEKQVSYLAWAKKDAVLEESHDSEDEYLFMMSGKCSVTVNGQTGFYEKGDLIYIPKNAVHSAKALSDEIMLLVGQRIAA